MGKRIAVIGGGIIGLSSAYYLNKSGHQVTLLDKGDISSGASFVNAGYLTPSHIIPLAAPGVLWQGLRWMMDPSSPLYMKARWDPDFFRWAWYFHKSSTKAKVARAIPIIKEVNLLSRQLYEDIKASGDLGDFHLERKGLLMLYQTETAFAHEWEVAQKALDLGLEVSTLDAEGLQGLQPNVAIAAKGAFHYACDGHTTPTEFMPKMLDYLKKNHVELVTQTTVQDLEARSNKMVKIKTSRGTYTADEVVLAAGSWSGNLARKLGLRLPLQAGKGYSINVPRETGITLPAILMESKMAVTPMCGFTRFAGTMEFSGWNGAVRRERVEALARGAKKFYPELEITAEEQDATKIGLRPVSPDGLPYIGKLQGHPKIIVATGHAMMGWSLGPITGKLVQQLVDGEKPATDLDPFRPERKFR